MSKNYTLAQSWSKSNIQDRLWYCMDEADKATLLVDETVLFGDKVYVVKTKKLYICGNDCTWYDM